MYKTYLILAALLGALSVILGAFGAHGLKSIVSPDVLEIYETAVRYQFYHVFALLAVGLLMLHAPQRMFSIAGIFFIAGILLFCGSLYLITALKAGGKEIATGIGILTPIGGLLFIIGWLSLFGGLLKMRS